MKKIINVVQALLTGLLLSCTVLQAAEVEAVLDWADERGLGTTVSARVSAVHVKPGMLVGKDSVLLELDNRVFKIQQRRAQAMMKAAGLELEEARLEQERAIELYDRTVLSQFDRRQADVGLAKAQSVYAQARAENDRAELDIEYSRLTARYPAVILSVHAAVDEVINNQIESQVLVRIARADQMRAIAYVSADALKNLKPGQQLEAAFRGEWLAASVDAVSLKPAQSSNQALYQVAVVFDVDPQMMPRAGEKSAIRLP